MTIKRFDDTSMVEAEDQNGAKISIQLSPISSEYRYNNQSISSYAEHKLDSIREIFGDGTGDIILRVASALLGRYGSLQAALVALSTPLSSTDGLITCAHEVLRVAQVSISRLLYNQDHISADLKDLIILSEYIRTRMASQPVGSALVIYMNYEDKLAHDEVTLFDTKDHADIYISNVEKCIRNVNASSIIFVLNRQNVANIRNEDLILCQKIKNSLGESKVYLFDCFVILSSFTISMRQEKNI